MINTIRDDKQKKDLHKFYEKIRQIIKDKDEEEQQNAKRQGESSGDVQFAEIIPPEPDPNYFGRITKDEFYQLLSVHRDNPQNYKTGACPQAPGGNFAKYLHSKPGFHHIGSTRLLVKYLGIKDSDRDSFLGGSLTYSTNKDASLQTITKAYHKSIIESKFKIINDTRRSDEEKLAAANEVLRLDRHSADALVARGRVMRNQQKHSDAISDFRRALDGNPTDRDAVTKDLSRIHSHLGVKCYLLQNNEEALDHLEKARTYDKDNEEAQLHRKLVLNKLRDKYPNARPRPSDHYQRRR